MNTDTFYQIIEKAIRSFDTIVYFDKGTTENDVRLAIRWVMRDNPDIFWFVHQYSFDDKNCRLELTYQYSSNKVWQINKSIDDVVEYDFNIKHVRTLDIVSQIMYVYKWLLTYCNYNAYSAFN